MLCRCGQAFVKSLLEGVVIQNSPIEADDIGTGRQINAVEVGLTSFPKAKLHELPIRPESDCRALFWRKLAALKLQVYLRGRHVPTLSLHPSAPVIKVEHASSTYIDAPRFYQPKGLPSRIGS
jgi:hypothetical protein